MRKLRVLWLPADDGGCGYHRVKIFNEALNRLGIAESGILKVGQEHIEQLVEASDVIVGRLNTYEFIKIVKESWPDKVVVFDWDDNTLEVSPSNTAYKEFGSKDVWVKVDNVKDTEFYKNAPEKQKSVIEQNGLPLWVTGITEGFNRYANLSQHTNLLWCLQACDLATSPTPTLTALWDKYAEKSAVVSNCLDLGFYPDVRVERKRDKGEIRLGWSGGSSHSGDWKDAVPVLEKLSKKYNLKIVMAGSSYPEHFKGLNIEFHPWVSSDAHPYRMKLLDLDFALIPLADTDFNSYKSELKMMEFAALRVPMIVKDQLPYSPYIKDRAIPYKNAKELEEAVERLIKNPGQKDMVKNAYKWVSEERNVDLLAPRLVELYRSLLPESVQRKISIG